jgi:hypothetical protein
MKSIAEDFEKDGCNVIGGRIGANTGGDIGFLGNAAGPEVDLPATILGTALG